MRGLALLAVVAIGVPAAVLACGKTKSTKVTREECDALRLTAAASARKASDEARPSSEPACYSNAGCVEVPRPSCVEGCNGYAAPRASSPIASALRAIEDGPCKKWHDGDCARIAPTATASCAAFVPACKDGGCVMRDAREVLSAAECEALLASSNREVEAKLAAADRACKNDDDCTLTLGGCVNACGGPAVAKRGKAAYEAEHASVAAICKKWWEGDCMTTTPQPIPSCRAIYARCAGGRCTASP